MATLDRVAELAPQLRPRLVPGESLREVLRVDLTLGTDEQHEAERSAKLREAVDHFAPRATKPPPGGLRGVAARIFGGALDIASNNTALNLPLPPDLPDPNGVGVRGTTGSSAVRLRDALAGKANGVFAITDRRVFILRDPVGAAARARAQEEHVPAQEYQIVDEIPADEVRSIALRPKQLQRGRVEISFVDGSVLAVSALRSTQAKRLLAAAPFPPA